MLYVLGTPKLVVHSVIGLHSIQKYHNSLNRPVRFYDDRPFCWTGGFPLVNIALGDVRVFMNSDLALGGANMLDIWKVMQRTNCDCALLLPYTLKDILSTIDEIKATGFKLRRIATGGQIVEDSEKLIGTCCDDIMVVYGATEFSIATNVICADPNFTLERGNVGKPFSSTEVRIVDEQFNVTLRGRMGSVELRGNARFKQYLNNESLTSSTITPDGWVRTHDLGVISEQGDLIIKGRSKDIISRGTRKILPGYIEEIIHELREVNMVVVIGVPDKRLGEEICVCFESKCGSVVSESDVKVHCEKTLVTTSSLDGLGEMPKYFLKFDKLPRLPNAKIDKQSLRAYTTTMLEIA